jgi:hypothetical protein
MSDHTAEPVNFRWSFSQWETYNQCPAKWAYGSKYKLPRKPPGPAAARGLDVHDTVEHYIKGADASTLHEAVKPKYIPVLDAFRNHPNGERYTEKKLAFDSDWYLCSPLSKFTACVAVLDAVRCEDGTVHIGEWKSGRPKDTHVDQRKLYAMFGMKAWIAERVEVTTYYLEDTAPPQRLTINSPKGFDILRNMWDERIKSMRRDEICAPKPNWGCKYCDFSKAAGGPCQFGA